MDTLLLSRDLCKGLEGLLTFLKPVLHMFVLTESDYSGAKGLDIDSLHDKPVDKVEDWMPDDGKAKKEASNCFQAVFQLN